METLLKNLNWPICTLMAVIFFCLMFQKQIRALLSRTKSIGKAGLDTFEPQSGQLGPENKGRLQVSDPKTLPAVANQPGLEEFLKTFDNPLIAEVEENITSSLISLHIDSAEDKVRALTRELARCNVLLTFEHLHSIIWRSQVDSLRYLNSTTIGAPKSDLIDFYEIGKTKYPGYYENYGFEQWLSFLMGNLLVIESGDKIQITVRGKEYLKYIVDLNKSGPYNG